MCAAKLLPFNKKRMSTLVLQVTANIWPSSQVKHHANYVKAYFRALGFPLVENRQGFKLIEHYEDAECIRQVVGEIPVMATLKNSAVNLTSLATRASEVLAHIAAQGEVCVFVVDSASGESWRFSTNTTIPGL